MWYRQLNQTGQKWPGVIESPFISRLMYLLLGQQFLDNALSLVSKIIVAEAIAADKVEKFSPAPSDLARGTSHNLEMAA
jgi:hypothetical protein